MTKKNILIPSASFQPVTVRSIGLIRPEIVGTTAEMPSPLFPEYLPSITRRKTPELS